MDTGNTDFKTKTVSGIPVQPRGYGEHIPFSYSLSIVTGSAPWIRGTHLMLHLCIGHIRFSPVDTGNTYSVCHCCDNTAVQPRGYGEHLKTTRALLLTCGSAPWIRGTLLPTYSYYLNYRFSPVDTGNTPAFTFVSKPGTVQPRGYGEHQIKKESYNQTSGSAPWIRGTLKKHQLRLFVLRFSPVDTGNTSFSCFLLSIHTVQPRGYGEHIR